MPRSWRGFKRLSVNARAGSLPAPPSAQNSRQRSTSSVGKTLRPRVLQPSRLTAAQAAPSSRLLEHHPVTEPPSATPPLLRRALEKSHDVKAVCRNGGDEFLYLWRNPKGLADTERIAASVIHSVGRGIHVGQHELTVRPSTGIAIYPDDGASADALIRNADAAMYRAKRTECGYAVHRPVSAGQH